jgi:hypothetical protein
MACAPFLGHIVFELPFVELIPAMKSETNVAVAGDVCGKLGGGLVMPSVG